MTKSELFKEAHRLTKSKKNNNACKSYRVLFSESLRKIHQQKESEIVIDYHKNENGFAVYFDKELRISFKEWFKTAKWNPEKKYWQVGKRSEKKLRQWIEKMNEAQKLLEESEIRLANEEELHLAEQELSRLQVKLSNIEFQKEKAVAAKLATQEAAKKIKEVKEKIEREKQEKESAQQSVKELLSSIVDLDELHKQQKIMERNHAPSNRYKKERFEEARAIIRGMRISLEEAGIESEGISEMSYARVNRPDRDSVSHITNEHIFNVSKIN